MADLNIFGKPFSEQGVAYLLKDAIATGRCNPVLRVFWAAFKWQECEDQRCRDFERCRAGDCLSASRKMKLLRAVAAINLYETPQWGRNKKVRSYFNETGPYGEMKPAPCFICGQPFRHRHHILQIQHGGHNAPRNIVLLCKPCHRSVHAA